MPYRVYFLIDLCANISRNIHFYFPFLSIFLLSLLSYIELEQLRNLVIPTNDNDTAAASGLGTGGRRRNNINVRAGGHIGEPTNMRSNSSVGYGARDNNNRDNNNIRNGAVSAAAGYGNNNNNSNNSSSGQPLTSRSRPGTREEIRQLPRRRPDSNSVNMIKHTVLHSIIAPDI